MTQIYDTSTIFQISNRRIWVRSSPSDNSSLTLISTDKYGSATTEAYMHLIENVGIDFRALSLGGFNFKCAGSASISMDKGGVTVKQI